MQTRTKNLTNKEIEQERILLERGFQYDEVAQLTGYPRASIATRNNRLHHVDIRKAFANRVKRDGTPTTLECPLEFGLWFSGFFDGEGSFLAYWAGKTYNFGISVTLRDDDSDVLETINHYLPGKLYRKPRINTSNPQVNWRIHTLKSLQETIVPLFEKYPLKSKKHQEFEIWKSIVLERYIKTCRASCNSKISPKERLSIDTRIEKIQQIRRYE